MNILSIDVGMKNLAICLFNITDDLNYKIKLWDVINLCNEKDYYCGEINNKTKKICNKKAKFTKNNKYYCKIHAKNKDFKIPPPELNLKKLKN